MPENKPPYRPYTRETDGSVYEKVKNLIVLMLENRSFDHVLGSLSLPSGAGPVAGLSSNLFNLDTDGVAHRVAPLSGTKRKNKFSPDPPHDPESVKEQIRWPYRRREPPQAMGGFIRAYERRYWESQGARPKRAHEVIGYHDQTTLPATYDLAASYTICDYWYSAVPTDTIPNRLYSIAGTAFGAADSHAALKLRDDPCVFDFLDHDWVVYSGGLALAMLFNPIRKLKCDRSCPAAGEHFRSLDQLLENAYDGNLRKVSWVEPIYTWEKWFPSNWFKGPNDDHPPSKVRKGQHLLASIYSALATGKSWDQCAMVFTYDEHGGFYDHVVPPDLPMGPGLDYHTRYGVRVPTLVVSPFASATPNHDRFDHCSVLKFIVEWVATPQIKAWASTLPRITSDHIQNLAVLLTDDGREPMISADSLGYVLTPPFAVADRNAVETNSSLGSLLAVLEYQISRAQPDFPPLRWLAEGGIDPSKSESQTGYLPPWERDR